ncbi:MAG: class II fructose-bisphosphate aldolase [Patescibacteria group bacterium]|nr:class II fructose-bisphosphate aldolase [Patescibacteria group bacterium]
MNNLKDVIDQAGKKGVAVGHFNISDSVALKAIFEAAQELRVPVIIGTSEGEAKFLGRNMASAMVKRLRVDNDFPIFLNSDHTHSMDEVRDAVSAGYDAIIFDASKLPFEENIKQTKLAVEYIRSKSKDILIEGEIGFIGSSSQVLTAIPSGIAISPESLTKPEDAARFVKETGVDLLAPAVGNLHGIVMAPDANGVLRSINPRLDIKRIGELKNAVNVPLVLHGGSGIADDDFRSAIGSGISIVHINTEIRLAWKNKLEESLKKNRDEVAPYKILEPSLEGIRSVVKARLQLFNKLI